MAAAPEIRWHASASEISPTLWEACFPAPLEGQWWYEALEQSELGDQFTFFYAVVSQAGSDVAIAPGFVMDVPISNVVPEGLLPLFKLLGKFIPALLVQRTLFIGSPCSDEGTLGITPGADRAGIFLAVQRAMFARGKEMKAPMFAWKDFPDSDKEILLQVAKMEKLFPLASYPGTRLSLPENKEAYFAALKGSHRHQLKKKLRKSVAEVAVRTEIIQSPDAETLDEIFALFWQNYERATTKFETLNREFFNQVAQCKQSHFILLKDADGKLLAFMLCFLSPGEVINKFIGIDHTRPKEWLLYFRLWEAALNWSIAQKAHIIQSGQTTYKPKIETGHSLVPLTHYCRHRNGLIHFIYKTFARSVTWATLDKDLATYLKAHPDL